MSAWRIGTETPGVPRAGGTRRGGQPRRRAADPGDRGATQEPQVASFFDRLTKWIPGDTLAFYAPGVTALAASNSEPSVVFLIIMIVATFLFVVGAAFSTGRPIERKTWLAAVLAAVAFTIWSVSVPFSGWQSWSFIADHQEATAIGAALVGILFSQFAEGVIARSGD